MQAGELIVTGRDRAVIPLHGLPREVKCHFKHGCDVVPCNPHHEDCLEYEVESHHSHHHNHHRSFVLVIKWHVSGVREIVWRVHY